MKLTGQDIHQVERTILRETRTWGKLSPREQWRYNDMADELNKLLEQDEVTITAARCPWCDAMLEVEHAEGHACWQVPYQVRSDWSTLQKELGT